MDKDNWRIWNSDDKVELRTYKRVTGELPEMESTKQLVDLLGEVYVSGMKILDVGCAAGHYYKPLKRVDKNLDYTGIDATASYIEFARDYFKDTEKAKFYVADIYNLPEEIGFFDIVFSCNVILHLPDFRAPIENLLKVTNKYCFIRTLVSDRTYLHKFLYADEFDENNNPTNFVHQNTYSFSLLKNYIDSLGNYDIELIEDKFNGDNINQEFEHFKDRQFGVTRVVENKQIVGNMIFDWAWLKIISKGDR